MEKTTKQSLKPIFEQYLNYSDLPILNYSLKKKRGRNYAFEYAWKANVDDFKMPVVLNIGNSKIILSGTKDKQTQQFKVKKGESIQLNEELLYFKADRVN
jgi:hypothetical protein